MRRKRTEKLTATVLAVVLLFTAVPVWADTVSDNSTQEITETEDVAGELPECAFGLAGVDGDGIYGGLIAPEGTQLYEEAGDIVAGSYNQIEARSMLPLINNWRKSNPTYVDQDGYTVIKSGLKDLVWDYGLEQIAMQRAAELAKSFSHTRPNGQSCFSAYEIVFKNKSYGAAGENIAMGSTNANAEYVFAMWREDGQGYAGQGHRRNMLGGSYGTKYIGIARFNYNGAWYYVQEFSGKSSGLAKRDIALDPINVYTNGNTNDYTSIIKPFGTVKANSGSGSAPQAPGVITQGIIRYVYRLYNYCFDRDPEEEGLQNWCQKLAYGQADGAGAAAGFVFSQEFKNKNYCNSCYVKRLYRTFMGREADAGGLADWVGRLNNGASREEVFNGFVGSAEFAAICAEAGIQPGGGTSIPAVSSHFQAGTCPDCGQKDGISDFVERLYRVCLDRNSDASGKQYWIEKVQNGERTGTTLAAGFVFSREFTNHNYSNGEFLEHMYSAFFDRQPDTGGYNYWLSRMNSGELDRNAVFNGFANSREFSNLCGSYGIPR